MDAPEGVYKYAADTTKTEAALDWTPEVSLIEDLAETYAWAAEGLGADEELSVAKADGELSVAKADGGDDK